MSDTKRDLRIAMMARATAWPFTEVFEKVDRLAGLSDEDFKAHADYMSEKLAEYKSASDPGEGTGPGGTNEPPRPAPTKLQQIPKATDKPAPMAGTPTKVKTLPALPDLDAPVSDKSVLDSAMPNPAPVLANIVEYMSDFFDIEDTALAKPKASCYDDEIDPNDYVPTELG
jgi:hypothetical protein